MTGEKEIEPCGHNVNRSFSLHSGLTYFVRMLCHWVRVSKGPAVQQEFLDFFRLLDQEDAVPSLLENISVLENYSIA
jgi:hypothetical protein